MAIQPTKEERDMLVRDAIDVSPRPVNLGTDTLVALLRLDAARQRGEVRDASSLFDLTLDELVQHYKNADRVAVRAARQRVRVYAATERSAARRPKRVSKAQALVDYGLADNLAEARAQLRDMGE